MKSLFTPISHCCAAVLGTNMKARVGLNVQWLLLNSMTTIHTTSGIATRFYSSTITIGENNKIEQNNFTSNQNLKQSKLISSSPPRSHPISQSTIQYISKHWNTLNFLLRFDSASILSLALSPPNIQMFNFLICTCVQNGNLSLAKKIFSQFKHTFTKTNIDTKSKYFLNRIIVALLKRSLKSSDFSIEEAEEYFSYLEKLGCVTNRSLITMLEMYRTAFEMEKAFKLADRYHAKFHNDLSGVLVSRIILISSKLGNNEKRTEYGNKYLSWLNPNATIEAKSMCYENLIACYLHNPHKTLEILVHMEQNHMIISDKVKEFFFLQYEIKKLRRENSESSSSSKICLSNKNVTHETFKNDPPSTSFTKSSSFDESDNHQRHSLVSHILQNDRFWTSLHHSSSINPNTNMTRLGSARVLPDKLSFSQFSRLFSSHFIMQHYK